MELGLLYFVARSFTDSKTRSLARSLALQTPYAQLQLASTAAAAVAAAAAVDWLARRLNLMLRSNAIQTMRTGSSSRPAARPPGRPTDGRTDR